MEDRKLSNKLDKNGKTEEEYLKEYDVNAYERGPSISVDNLVFVIQVVESENVRKLGDNELQVLLIKRDEHPYIDYWSLPGAFVGKEETLEKACKRCLKDKTSIEGIKLEELGVFDDVNRDPRTRIISIAYICLLNKEVNNLMGNRGECDWFTITKSEDNKKIILENKDKENKDSSIEKLEIHLKIKDNKLIVGDSDLPFDHGKLIYLGIEKLKKDIEEDDLAFSLMPEKFTLAQLQQVYNLFRDENNKYTKANFTRKIKDKIIETDEYFNGGFRPAKLYKYKEKDNENSN